MKSLRMRRTLIEWMLSAGGVAIVVAAIASMDGRSRMYVVALAGAPEAGIRDLGVAQSASRVAHAAWDLCRDHQPLALFAAAASVLLLFMLRTK